MKACCDAYSQTNDVQIDIRSGLQLLMLAANSVDIFLPKLNNPYYLRKQSVRPQRLKYIISLVEVVTDEPSSKPWLIQSFLTFDSMDRTLHWKAAEQYFTTVVLFFMILQNLLILDLALVGMHFLC